MMRFCSVCAAPVCQRFPETDNHVRDVCCQCGTVFYENPKIVPGTISVFDDKVLLCRRAIGPRYGCWTLPAGFLECGETVEEGALRETLEEACAKAVNPQLYLLANIVEAGQVHAFYRAELAEPQFGVGDETLETRLFSEEELPWHQLSFRTVFYALHYFFEDRRQGKFKLREIKMPRIPQGNISMTYR